MSEELKRGDLVLFRRGSEGYLLYSFLYSDEFRGGDVMGVCLGVVGVRASRGLKSSVVRVYIGLTGRVLLLGSEYLERV